MPRFQARAKAFIVTFPQVSQYVQQRFDHEGASLLLNITQDLKDPACFRLGRERHQDGGVHYHMYIGFDEVVHINRPNLFDYFGAHGNIKSVRRTPRTVYDYCGKDGDVRYERGDPPESVSRSRGENGEKWHTICDAPDKDTFLSLCRQLAPKDWLLSNSRILEYANTYYPEVPSPYEGPPIIADMERYPELERWLEQARIGDDRPERVKSLILYGPSRTGKTLFARSLGEHAYFNLQFNMDGFSDGVKYAVFDDIQGGFEFWHSYKGWLGAQKEFVITDKYRKKRTIKWGKPTIMCLNENPNFLKGVDYEWLHLNCVIIEVLDPICHLSS